MSILLMILACGDKETYSQPEQTQATVQLLSIITGGGIENVALSSLEETELTDTDGRAVVNVFQEGDYTITAAQQGSMNHSYQGKAGATAFEIIGFLVNRTTTDMVFSQMGIEADPDKGIVVAALDNPDLSPAVGAAANLKIRGEDYPEYFIFGATGTPIQGNEIEAGGSSFVFFPNVNEGLFDLTATGASGTICSAHPTGDSTYTVSVMPDTVSVVVFQCN